jgi:exodeoxyribonuclease V beta subunit
MRKVRENFDAANVPLRGSNLIEASAGTGKTYSIAILVLRMLLENELSVKEILMVTFTKAAVSELEDRTRLFIRQAYRASRGETIEDKTIGTIVERAITRSGADKVRELLNEARLFLDETAVMTIHSFCQQSLSEFAFETDQLFGAEILQDTSALIEQEVNRFWREQVTVLDPQLLKALLNLGLCRPMLYGMVEKQLDGTRYLSYDPDVRYTFRKEEQAAVIQELDLSERTLKDFKTNLWGEVERQAGQLRTLCESNTYARKGLLPSLSNPEAFLSAIYSKKDTGYIQKLFPEWLDKMEQLMELKADVERQAFLAQERLIHLAIQEVGEQINRYKMENSLLTFNDMIVRVSEALGKEKGLRLVEELRKKYKAVFIDEFQDTDRHQYHIFKTAFGQDAILFYIGDPKQSIYAWRQADLATYFKATNEVDCVYTMNTNYRSSEAYIKAMNAFFLPVEGFDTFHFSGTEETIRYVPVEPPSPNRKGILTRGGAADVPISIFESPKREEVNQDTCRQIADLLVNKEWKIENGERARAIKPSDIGVLVRKTAEGKAIQRILGQMGIPAITLDDSKVLQSREAQYLYYLLKALADPTDKNINTALLSPLTGYRREDILQMDMEHELDNFKNYKVQWSRQGIYATLTKFLVDYEVKDQLMNDPLINGERSLTNVLQLIEILQKVESSRNYGPWELLNWLKRGLEGMRVEGDEYEQRVESDREAVEIVTIHKSKGLEYNIVFAPTLDLILSNRRDFCSFKDEDSGSYVYARAEEMSEQLTAMHQRQEEQENRRLLYVAITRAVYKCFLGKNTYHLFNNSSLSAFLSHHFPPDLIRSDTPSSLAENFRYSGSSSGIRITAAVAQRFPRQVGDWKKLSFSSLKKDLPYVFRPSTRTESGGFDQFIFHQLQKGSLTGNMLHDIFEHADFMNKENWGKVINHALSRFMPRKAETYLAPLQQLLDETLGATISASGTTFSLSEIGREKRLNELEFDFNVDALDPAQVNTLSEPTAPFIVNGSGRLAGVMNGKVDLLFEQGGRFYIVDWKSNFLGDSLSDYQTEKLEEAMTSNNYHLQYLIYTVAVVRYLSLRIPDFDYERDFGGIIYLFVRGTRKGSNTGVFTARPEQQQILRLEKALTTADIK